MQKYVQEQCRPAGREYRAFARKLMASGGPAVAVEKHCQGQGEGEVMKPTETVLYDMT
jgi:hypothetical protein